MTPYPATPWMPRTTAAHPPRAGSQWETPRAAPGAADAHPARRRRRPRRPLCRPLRRLTRRRHRRRRRPRHRRRCVKTRALAAMRVGCRITGVMTVDQEASSTDVRSERTAPIAASASLHRLLHRCHPRHRPSRQTRRRSRRRRRRLPRRPPRHRPPRHRLRLRRPSARASQRGMSRATPIAPTSSAAHRRPATTTRMGRGA